MKSRVDNSFVAIFLMIVLKCAIASQPTAAPIDESPETVEKNDEDLVLSENLVENYMDKVNHVNALRRQIQTQINVMSHLLSQSSPQGKYPSADSLIKMSYLNKLRQTFNEMNEELELFIPNDHELDAYLAATKNLKPEFFLNFANLKRSAGGSGASVNNRYDWYKRNTFYSNKVPVIRNGK